MSETHGLDLRLTLPTATQVLVPVVDALRAGGGSATNAEINAFVIDTLKLSEEQQQVMRADGRRSQIEQVISEAKSYLKRADLATISRQGVWALSEAGEKASTAEIEDAPRKTYKFYRRRRQAAEEQGVSTGDGAPSEGPAGVSEAEHVEPELDWTSELVSHLLTLSPDAFERLAQRLLREAGFDKVKVRGRSGDGGIDGEGVYRPLPLIGFQVYWQSKRYAGSVAAEDVRNFRGAMMGRGDKGLFITTGTFTGPAREEASREGAPPIDLIDGEALAQLLKRYGLGIRVTERIEEDIAIDRDWFDTL